MTTAKLAEVKRSLLRDRDELPATERHQSARNNQVGLKRTTFLKAKKSLKLHPFKLQIVPRGRIFAAEHPERVRFCEFVIQQSDDFFQTLISSDEKTFSLDEHLNRQTNRCYSEYGKGCPENFVVGVSSQGSKVMTWGAVLGNGTAFIHIFPKGCKVTGKEYHKVLVKFSAWLAGQLGCKVSQLCRQKVIFQQDGALVHTTEENLKYLVKKYGLIISRVPVKHQEIVENSSSTFIHWPPRSPDLSPMDHYFWSALKERVYRHPPPQTEDELRRKIKAAVSELDPEELKRGVRGMRGWAQEIIAKNGAHIN